MRITYAKSGAETLTGNLPTCTAWAKATGKPVSIMTQRKGEQPVCLAVVRPSS
jgi:hypothetical protein